MDNQKYMNMLMVFSRYLDSVVIYWANGMITKCVSDFGINETGLNPNDEEYVGEYYTVVKVVEILENGSDSSILIFNDYIEISLVNIPNKIELEDGTVLWEQ